MANQPGDSQGNNKGSGFKLFATKRIITAAVLIILMVWILGVGLESCDNSTQAPIKSRRSHIATTGNHVKPDVPVAPKTENSQTTEKSKTVDATADKSGGHSSESANTTTAEPGQHAPTSADTEKTQPSEHTSKPADTGKTESSEHASESATPHAQTTDTVAEGQKATSPDASTATASHSTAGLQHKTDVTRGVTFVDAIIKPIDYELNKRFWGWRPNDILNFTDNINYFQLGVLEVTRRSVVMLAERISRTGSTDAFNPNLEDAANWLMITATRYWFPSPESKYKECITELQAYKEQLNKGTASFYTRTDNLIPLLSSYEDLLGSCDENLVKRKNEDGSAVSYFKADDFFFYAKGVASAMIPILEAIHHDFLPTLESRHGTELLHHALISCQRAAALSPLLVTDMELDGIFANHRANMAAPISHARFYLGQLIKTLST